MKPSSRKQMGILQVPSLLYLWLAVLIFAASNSVTRKVTEIGATHLVNGRNPISLCNVLFVGNLCALAVMLLVFGKTWNRQTLRQLTRQDWISLGVIAILSGALGPALIFSALDNTSVTNVVLIGRLETPLALVLGILFLGARINGWTLAGSIVSFLGVATTAFGASSGHMIPLMGGAFQIGRGELQAAVAALVLAIAAILTKSRLQSVPLGIFSIVRVAIGTIVFFLLARTLYGPQHFAEALSPFLWQWMLLYGSIIVVAGQLCWLAGLRGSTAAEGTLASSCSPIAAVVMAYLILGEVPTMAQYVGGVIILVGILLSLIGSLHETKSRNRLGNIVSMQQMEMAIGFKGI